MPFNGSGTFNRLYSWAVDAANSISISSSRMDAEMNGFAAGLTDCITRDGQSPPSTDIPWGAKKITNLGAATAGTDALNRDTGDARYITQSVGGGVAMLTGSTTVDPPSLAPGSTMTFSISVTGLLLSKAPSVIVGATADLASLTLTAYCNGDGNVSVTLRNNQGASIDMASATFWARCFQ